MKKNLLSKLTLLLFTLLFSVAATYSADYTFIIEVDHNFDNNQEIVCEVEYDDNTRTWSFDDDDDSADYEYEKDFDDYVNLDCDTVIDDINLEIFDKERELRIDRENYDDVDGFEYDLDAVDKDENWFELEIDHSFGTNEEIECEIMTDLKVWDYEFSDETENDDLIVRKNFNDDFQVDCEEEIDEMILKVYDEDEELIFEKTYDDRDYFDFNIEDDDDLPSIRIEIDHDFGDDTVSCNLELDAEDENLVFDKGSTSSELNFLREFREEVIFDCNDRLDDIYVFVYDSNGDRIDSLSFENEDQFEYEYTDGEYEVFMQITHDFGDTEEIECELTKDSSDNAEDFDFLDSSSIGELRIEEDFEKEFEFTCDEKFDKIELLIFSSDTSDDEILDEVIYTDVDEIYYEYNKEGDVEEPVDETPIPVEPDGGIGDGAGPIIEEPIEGNVSAGSGSDSLNTGSSSSEDVTTNTESEVIETTPEVTEEPKDNNGLGLFFKILLAVIAIVIIFTFFLSKLSGKVPGNKPTYHSHRSSKSEIDFSFLNKKK